MTARISEGTWRPLPESLPEMVNPHTIYVLPTRAPVEDTGVPLYIDSVRLLPKQARINRIPVEFATPGRREFLSEFSIDPDVWSLGLACLQMANDWIIAAVVLYIEHRANSQGWVLERAYQQPLRVTVAETSTGRNYEIEGDGSAVIEALKILQKEQDKGNGGPATTDE